MGHPIKPPNEFPTADADKITGAGRNLARFCVLQQLAPPRDAMRNRGSLLVVGRCLSVCHSGVLYQNALKTAKEFIVLDPVLTARFCFLRPSAVRANVTQFPKEPLSEASNAWKWGNLRFSTEIAVYLGNSNSCYETLIASHMQPIDPSVPMTLSGLEKQGTMG